MRNVKWAVPVLLLIAAVTVPLYTVSESQEVTPPRIAGQISGDTALRAMFPTVVYEDYLARPENAQKEQKYQRSMRVLTDTASKDVESILRLEWHKDFAPMPVDNSHVIILGTITDSAAHLTTRRHTVFTEATIQIEKVFKNFDTRDRIEVGRAIVGEREGGVVKYPSGFKIWHHIGQQGMPVVGKRYYIFLSHDFPILGEQRQLYILTAYEAADGLISPMDSADKFAIYKGKNESEFQRELLASLSVDKNKKR